MTRCRHTLAAWLRRHSPSPRRAASPHRRGIRRRASGGAGGRARVPRLRHVPLSRRRRHAQLARPRRHIAGSATTCRPPATAMPRGRAGGRRSRRWVGGLPVLYVGQQAWEGVPDREPGDSATAGRPVICSRTLLADSTGRRDADDAIARAAADGFPRGTVIFLDIEPVSTPSPRRCAPTTGRGPVGWWRRAGIARGCYAHRRNADDIVGDMRAVLRRWWRFDGGKYGR